MSRRPPGSFRRDNTAHLLSEEDRDHGQENWAISYGDMVTLLLCFFVLFFGSREQSKVQVLQKELTKENKMTPPPPQPAPTESAAGRQIEEAAKALSHIEKVAVTKDNRNFIVEFPAISFFDFRDTKLTPEGRHQLEDFATVYKNFQNEFRLVVIGYTDGVHVSTKRPKHSRFHYTDNLELSALRGVAGVRFLSELGLSLDNMRVGGEGEWRIRQPATTSPTGETTGDPSSRKIVLVVETGGTLTH